MAFLVEYLVGIILILYLAIFAFKREALTEGGTLTAIAIGLLVFLFPRGAYSGRIWIALLAVFFVTSYFVTKLRAKEKVQVNKEFAKGSTRDLMQVFANGGVAALAAVFYYLYPVDPLFVGFCVVLATVNADTWATEIGVLSRYKPTLLTTFKQVRRGTSGAISLPGLLAAVGGAGVIALAAIAFIYLDSKFGGAFFYVPSGIIFFAVFVTLFGTAGSMLDSLFGATMQTMYYCKKCKKETERRVHKCGSKTVYLRGIKWFDNDVVNLVSSLIAGSAAIILYVAFLALTG